MIWKVNPKRVITAVAIVVLGLPAAVVTGAFLLALVDVFAPFVDDATGGSVSNYALQLVQNHRESSKTVKQLVDERFRDVKWRAYHREYIQETYVRCDALTPSGKTVAMVWVVTCEPTVEHFRPRMKITAFAHTQSAFAVAPSMRVAGHPLYDSPDYANW